MNKQKYALQLIPNPDRGMKTLLEYDFIAAPYKPVKFNSNEELKSIINENKKSCKGSVTVTGTKEEIIAMEIEVFCDEDFE